MNYQKNLPLFSIILNSIVFLLGIFYFGWDYITIFFLYCTELIILAFFNFFNIIKIGKANGVSKSVIAGYLTDFFMKFLLFILFAATLAFGIVNNDKYVNVDSELLFLSKMFSQNIFPLILLVISSFLKYRQDSADFNQFKNKSIKKQANYIILKFVSLFLILGIGMEISKNYGSIKPFLVFFVATRVVIEIIEYYLKNRRLSLA